MEEKKVELTVEEIVKALECCVNEEHKDCVHCGEFVSQFDCMRNAIGNALDLIHRLQDENKGGKERGEIVINSLHETIDKQKAEIERPTEENKKLSIKVWNYEQPARMPLYSSESMVHCNLVTCYNENYDLKAKNAELQKQVDELKLDLENWKKAAYGYKYGEEQAVKDTAKEILKMAKDNLDEHWSSGVYTIYNAIRNSYGVEVE